ncbi:MAG: cytochrome c biogenesis protein CcdA [Balneolaceae bacterium]|nr:cytochrome c biogenesis protein CcdA [Balneolaceae bacterium]
MTSSTAWSTRPMDFLHFSFLQGVLAFFAPCAVALLPGYIVSYVSREGAETSDWRVSAWRGFKLALLSILGILAVYLVAGLLIVVAAQLLKTYMKWIAMAMGGGLIILGAFMVAGRSVAYSAGVRFGRASNETADAFLFGLAYAIGALGCLFPLFLVVAVQAMAAPFWQGVSYLAAYFAGISGMMILAIVLSSLAREWFMRHLRTLLPHMERIAGVLLILAGIYVIHYQTALL